MIGVYLIAWRISDEDQSIELDLTSNLSVNTTQIHQQSCNQRRWAFPVNQSRESDDNVMTIAANHVVVALNPGEMLATSSLFLFLSFSLYI